ncbi:unnamed protein product [Gongylonema pulchrum]|uniref:BTB domain-containing protein n=1 Tax=Gongylonema pulchrum TaxID=637853 RepID=A0A183EJ52_9BILA|nr:unnamed protein product [Gongylonema pulchrum]
MLDSSGCGEDQGKLQSASIDSAVMSEGTINEFQYDAYEDYDVGLAERLNDFLDERIGCDVEFIVGDEKEAILAHKLVLACSSKVFATMFYGEMARRRRADKESTTGKRHVLSLGSNQKKEGVPSRYAARLILERKRQTRYE